VAEIEFTGNVAKADEHYRVVSEAIDALYKMHRLADRARADALEVDDGDIHIFCEMIMLLAKEHGRALDHHFGTMIGCFDREREVANG
jgi:hypothetical protein